MKKMKLRSTIIIQDNICKAISKHYDGTPFTVIVSEYDITDGWLFVDQVGQQGDRAAIVLPAASIEYGRNVTVSVHDLLPAKVTIKDYFHEYN